MLSYSWGMTSNKPGCEARHLRLYRLSRHPLYSSIATSVGRTAGSGDPRRTKRIRNDSSRDQRAVKTNFAACPRPLWVKVVRLPGLADGENVADSIPRVVGDRVGDEAREAVGGDLQALVEAAVVIDLNSIGNAPSESEAPRPVAAAPAANGPPESSAAPRSRSRFAWGSGCRPGRSCPWSPAGTVPARWPSSAPAPCPPPGSSRSSAGPDRQSD